MRRYRRTGSAMYGTAVAILQRRAAFARLVALACLVAILVLGASWIAQRLDATSPAPSASHTSAGLPIAAEVAHGPSATAIDWSAVHAESPGCIAWLDIDCGIDLPIMQADPDAPGFFLSHDRYGNENAYGCPYLDATCADTGFSSGNAIVFGHNMPDGTMFAPLAGYLDRDTALRHAQIIVHTPYLDTVYAICLVAHVDAETPLYRTSFEDGEAFRSWLHATVDAATIRIDEKRWLEASTTHTLTLATCYPNDDDARILIFAAPVYSLRTDGSQETSQDNDVGTIGTDHGQPAPVATVPNKQIAR